MRYQGKVTNWKDDQGFGFITPNGGGKQVFVHIKSFSNRQRRPVSNEIVTYELKTDVNGRLNAESVRFLGERMQSANSSERSNIFPILTAVFLAFVVGSVLSGKLPFAVLVIYLAASVITFGAYAFDKSAAKNDQCVFLPKRATHNNCKKATYNNNKKATHNNRKKATANIESGSGFFYQDYPTAKVSKRVTYA
jgi:cold shock CspA family protein